jgi:hypothetical protein
MQTQNNDFSSLLEQVLINIWGMNTNRLDMARLKQTRKAVSSIRAVYRFRGERHGTQQPSHVNYAFKGNRAGYLAAFGERHAYLSFLHLNKVHALNPGSVPLPEGRRNKLVITSLGAGACIELFGVCLYYLKGSTQPLNLWLNSIEKTTEWTSNRHVVFNRILKATFPKLDIDPLDINIDLRKDAIPSFAQHYDRLADTDILLIYNVMNEIPTQHIKPVWRNIKFLLDNFQKSVLILLMEPSADRAEPRIHQIKTLLAGETDVINEMKEEIFVFESDPVNIQMSEIDDCLNYRLFGLRMSGSNPSFETKVDRAHMACIKNPNSPLSIEQVTRQLSNLERKRGRRGAYVSLQRRSRQQRTFGDISMNWK